jgi:DNA invertase Pin-like site-specific DNA recombinase
MQQVTAIYVLVARKPLGQRSQEADLKCWADCQRGEVLWYRDSFTDRTMHCPGMERLLADVRAGKIDTVVVWRLDRLGRTARDLVALFKELCERGVGLVSLQEGFELSTPAGRLVMNVLASVAAAETEVRAERVRAGQAAARTAGKGWGGSKKGRLLKVTREQLANIHRMRAEGAKIAAIARATGLSRPTVYRVMRAEPEGKSPS